MIMPRKLALLLRCISVSDSVRKVPLDRSARLHSPVSFRGCKEKSRTTMSSQSDPKMLPLYQYVVPASLFVVTALTMSFYFRWRSAAPARPERELGGASAFDGAEAAAIPKPLLHDACVGGVELRTVAGSVAREWDEIMPLSVMHSVAWTRKGDDGRRLLSDSPPSRVLVSVIIGMPESTNYEETPLPCLELGLVKVDLACYPPKSVLFIIE